MATSGAAKKVNNSLTAEQVLDFIREGQGNLTLREYAAKIGISHPYLSNILNDPPTRSPGRKVLNYFGIGKRRKVVTTFEFFKLK